MAKVTCPCCGSTDVWFKQEPKVYTPPFGLTVQYEITTLHCTLCMEATSYEPGPDPKRVEAIHQHADQATVRTMLDMLKSRGYSQASIRRILGMEGYPANWRTGATEGVIALLRILATYPWILDVARQRFSREAARVAVEKAARAGEGGRNINAPLGTAGVRDPSAPCEEYEPGLPAGRTNCDGDGHYLCRECVNLVVPPQEDEDDAPRS